MPKYRRRLRSRFPVQLRESATGMAERVEIREAPVAGVVKPGSKGRMLIQLISEGLGSSGLYPSTTLVEAARRKVFASGTHVFIDHGTATEEVERPERSVKDLAAVLTEDARWEPSSKALVAEAQVFTPFRERFAELAPYIGLSIKASGLAEQGEYNGQPTMVISEIRQAQSVDFVTRAGRGGKVLALLESARTQLRETPASEVRAAIERAVKDTYGGTDIYVWLREYDPDRGLAWFEIGEGATEACWEQQYASNGADVALVGPRRQVVAETVYRPVDAESVADTTMPAEPEQLPMAYAESATELTVEPACGCNHPDPATEDPDGTPPDVTTTTIQGGPAMSGDQTGGTPASAGTTATEIQTREAAITAERDTALREAQAAQRELATYRAREQAGPIVDAIIATSGLPSAAMARVRAGVLGQAPLTESGGLDESRLRSIAEAETSAEKAYVALLQESAGVGRVSGVGATSAAEQRSAQPSWGAPEAEPNADLVESYVRRGLPRVAAVAAARGRAV